MRNVKSNLMGREILNANLSDASTAFDPAARRSRRKLPNFTEKIGSTNWK